MSDTRRCAIVTGSSRGIGAAVAERLAADGLAVVMNYSGRPEPAEELVVRIEAAGGKTLARKADIGNASEVAANRCWGSRISTRRMGMTGIPPHRQTEVAVQILTARSPSPYQPGTVMR